MSAHSPAGHLLMMVGIGIGIFAVLVVTGRSWSDALSYAALLACPVMLVVMMLMMGRQGHQHDPRHDASSSNAERQGTPHA
ncbi:DUF2933 domain-containing protein [Cellulomonas biazotea]|uniref:DUF2933 domain-containing protein n=1 Tax=Cellulomonas biazotea TaxID=1709 RepID=A0A402DRD4_9CELL|nr:DUF2933 domain-containing protein [Cellulomonas biazotea]GCE76710.1 hypothetical protein CBZ_17660 [Cellulomonas biazotea]